MPARPRRAFGRLLAPVAVLAASLAVTQTATAAAPIPALSTAATGSTWEFPVANWSLANKEAGRVDDMLRIGNTVFVGGNFTTASSHSGVVAQRTYLAAEDATTGALLPFAPVLNGRVFFLAASADRSTLYVGGQFTTVNGQTHAKLVAFDVATGQVSPSVPNMAINGTVKAIAPVGSDLYIGGAFTSVAGRSHVRLARLVGAARFAPDAAWNASASDEVRDLIADPATGRLLISGWFKALDGSTSSPHLGAVSLASGALLPWASHPTAEILDLARNGTALYAAMGGPGGTALAFDMTTGRQLWFYKTDGNVQAVATIGGYPVFGMHGDYVAPKVNATMSEYGTSARISRHKIFMLSPAGALQSWAPALTSTDGVLGVWALKSGTGSLYVGGDFTTVNGAAQNRFAIFSHL